jgi:hypothetical protein
VESMGLFGLPEYCVTDISDGPKLNEAIVEVNLDKAEIKYIKSFLEMEGNTATEKDILFLTSGSFKSLDFDNQLTQKDIEEVYAMKRALDYMKTVYRFPLTDKHLCAYNSLVVVGPKRVLSGELRETDVWINGTSYAPPKWELLPRLFSNMFSAVDCLEGDINKAVTFLLAISKNQFFIDGNKRTARLAAIHQLAHGRQKLLSPNLDTVQYMKALLVFYNTGDTKPFVEFFKANLFTL